MIKHIKCDIFESGADVICHQVNCQGVMGSGIAKQVRERYPWVYAHYRDLCLEETPDELLGVIEEVYINETQKIINIFGQKNFGNDNNRYTSYPALKQGFESIKDWHKNKTIAIPYKIGCARGGGDWNIVYKMIEEIFADYDGEVIICECDKG